MSQRTCRPASGHATDTLPPRTRAGLLAAFEAEIKDLPPAYFAMVMATGIVAIGTNLLGMRPLALVLTWLNIVLYIVLWVLTLLRLWRFTHDFAADLIDHVRGPGFFTIVAATSILGTQFISLWEDYRAATMFWVIGVFLWIGLTYLIFTGLIVKEKKPSLAEGITGAWLIAVVATQSVAVLAAFLAPHVQQPGRLEFNFFALSMWLWGGMLYIWMISLIFYRYTFFTFSPADLSPPYWINMGAMAISALGGSVLIVNADASKAPFLQATLPFIKGFTIFFWATGTWWIPMLIILAIWRHVYKRFPLTYDPLYWGVVFPLGMYTVATLRMAQAMDLDFLHVFPEYFIYVTLVVWLVVFIGLIRRIISVIRIAACVR
ncbi:MAG: tellurite resistance/C4-dicarboxylate transporter family protein [Chloroflexi bacterium]|nr:tellurite resistance/C4-dicarboxylate transporter family protein [Chloroflexota bacterium]